MKNFKTNFQDIHYLRQKPSFALDKILSLGEFFYKNEINFKNYLYEIKVLKEKDVNIQTICVGNLTTGGVGKTPIVAYLANNLSKEKKVAIISRGYGAKISNKNPTLIRDFNELKFSDGRLCGDEPYQLSKKVKNVVVITCADRKKAIEYAIVKFGIEVAILDDGFSNRKIKKDKTILAIDSKMRFGNNCLLPKGPLREPISEIKRANEIVLVNKNDENIQDAITWVKQFEKPVKLCKMIPKRVYNLQTGADVIKKNKAIAFCAIGQPTQFFDFAQETCILVDKVAYPDHYKYTQKDVQDLIKIAQKHGVNTFITTQKDETKLELLIKNISSYSFNILELETILEEI